MIYDAGEITVPAGGGAVSIETGFEAQGIVFFGTNFNTFESVVTPSGPGIFMGMAGPDIDSPGTIHQHALGIVVKGDAWCADHAAILAPHPDGSGASLYRAVVSSLDSDGFTLNFTQGAAGGYKVFYLAFGQAFDVGVTDSSVNPKDIGFRVRSIFGNMMLDLVGATDGTGSADFYHGATWGAASYPDSSFDWTTAFAAASSYPTSIGGQGYGEAGSVVGSFPIMGIGTHFIGPFLVQGSLQGYPIDDDTLGIGVDSDNFAHFLLWDGPSQSGIFSVPDEGDEATTSFALLEGVGAIFFFTISNAPSGQANNGGAVGFGVATEDFQACAVVDAEGSAAAYQSAQHGWVSSVDPGVVRAGTAEFDAEDVILTTVEGSAPPGSLVGIAFEDDEPAPGFFRRV